MSDKQSHLTMIQGIINRLASNSFSLKNWTVVLVSAVFALALKNKQYLFICVSFLPVMSFWFLDGYFLRQERLFRKLYDFVRVRNEDEIDFSMDARMFKDQVASWISVVFSRTLWPFYISIIVTIALVIIVSILFN